MLMKTDDTHHSTATIKESLLTIEEKVQAYCNTWDRSREEVSLIAVSKFHPVDAIEEAITAGQQSFGENRAQEVLQKWPSLKEQHPDVQLHFIGSLQRNKVKDIFPLCDTIHTLDRLSLAETIAKEIEKTGKQMPCYIQVNIGEEPQKSGILPNEADDFIKTCIDELHIPIKGLMCIPPAEEESAPYFALLSEMAKRHNLKELSMGMSADFETAIALGSTHIRVGTAIFGKRPQP